MVTLCSTAASERLCMYIQFVCIPRLFLLVTANPADRYLSKRQADTDNENEGLPPYIELLQGRDGRDGRDGPTGPRGPAGMNGEKGDTGDKGEPGPSTGGVTYIRWGRTTCPDTPGTELVYSGRAAGTHYTTQGGTSDLLCLPDDPQYLTYRPGVQGYSPIHGAEYQIGHDTLPLPGVHQDNAPCAVCVNCQRKVVLTIPARTTCPPSWTKEYCGYLMTERFSHRRREAACLDKNPEAVRGEAASTDGTLFYHTEAVCNGIDCPPYDPEKELTCVVCTK